MITFDDRAMQMIEKIRETLNDTEFEIREFGIEKDKEKKLIISFSIQENKDKPETSEEDNLGIPDLGGLI